MTQNDPTRHRFSRVTTLSFEQENAINLLLTGATDQSIATRLKIGRSTLYRWQRSHPGFIAELNRRRAAVRAIGMDGARSLIPRALETVRDQIVNGNGHLALAVLDKAGVFGSRSTGSLLSTDVGPTDVESVLNEEVRRRRADGRLPMPSAPHAASDVSTSSATSDPAASGDSKSVSVREPPITDQEREQVMAELLAELDTDTPPEPPAATAPAPNGTAGAAGTNGGNAPTVVTSGSMSSFR